MAFLDETGLAELWSLIDAKHAKIAIGSYKGAGTYGASNPNTLTFGFVPKLVIVHNGDGAFSYTNTSNNTVAMDQGYRFIWSQGQTRYKINTVSEYLSFTQSGNTLSWYVVGSTYASQWMQCNHSGTTYYYIAIG